MKKSPIIHPYYYSISIPSMDTPLNKRLHDCHISLVAHHDESTFNLYGFPWTTCFTELPLVVEKYHSDVKPIDLDKDIYLIYDEAAKMVYNFVGVGALTELTPIENPLKYECDDPKKLDTMSQLKKSAIVDPYSMTFKDFKNKPGFNEEFEEFVGYAWVMCTTSADRWQDKKDWLTRWQYEFAQYLLYNEPAKLRPRCLVLYEGLPFDHTTVNVPKDSLLFVKDIDVHHNGIVKPMKVINMFVWRIFKK